VVRERNQAGTSQAAAGIVLARDGRDTTGFRRRSEMFDYLQMSAELYVTAKGAGWSRSPMTYRRFETLAQAIAFACEDAEVDLGRTTIRTDGIDLHGSEIRQRYDSQDFPLPRHPR
jgi:hypothetical protein